MKWRVKHERRARARPSSLGKPRTSANDNDRERFLLIVPSAAVLKEVRAGRQEPSQRHSKGVSPPSTDRVSLPFIDQRAKTPPPAIRAGFRSSWKGMFGRLTYVAAISVAMFGWLYLLWLAMVTISLGMLS